MFRCIATFRPTYPKGDIRRLAEILHDDTDDIDCVFSELRSNIDKRALKEIFLGEIDKGFDRSEDPENPNLWIPRLELLGAYKKSKSKTVELSRVEKKAVNTPRMIVGAKKNRRDRKRCR